MEKTRKLALLALSGLALFLAGGALGFTLADRGRGLYPTESFIEERLAECGSTVALYDAAESARVRRLLTGDLIGCTILLDWFPDRIDPRHAELVKKIRTTHQQAQAANTATQSSGASPTP